MDLTTTKVVNLVLLGVIKLVSGLAPMFFTKILEKKSERFLKKFVGIVLCFGGGVLLATVLMHMLSEVRESIERAMEFGMLPGVDEYPFAELMVGLGFLMILMIESAVHKIFGGNADSHFPHDQETLAVAEGVDNNGYIGDHASPKLSKDMNSTNASPDDPKAGNNVITTIRSILFVVALSVHSLFEGLAIGLEEDNAGAWKLTLAIAIHAIPIVFCVGTDLISAGMTKLKIVIYIIVLSLNTPIGIFIGIMIYDNSDEESGEHILINGILQGLAAGTLLFITFFEVLARDKLTKYGMSGIVGAISVICGFALMAGLEVNGHSHDHGHSHGHSHE